MTINTINEAKFQDKYIEIKNLVDDITHAEMSSNMLEAEKVRKISRVVKAVFITLILPTIATTILSYFGAIPLSVFLPVIVRVFTLFAIANLISVCFVLIENRNLNRSKDRLLKQVNSLTTKLTQKIDQEAEQFETLGIINFNWKKDEVESYTKKMDAYKNMYRRISYNPSKGKLAIKSKDSALTELKIVNGLVNGVKKI